MVVKKPRQLSERNRLEQQRLHLAWLRVSHAHALRKGVAVSPSYGRPERVTSSRLFNGVFRRGEKVLDVHQFTIDPRKPRESVRQIIAQFAKWKAEGYVGIYGDTPTTPLLAVWKHHGAVIINSPPGAAEVAREHYMECVTRFGFPAKYVDDPVQRVIVRFP